MCCVHCKVKLNICVLIVPTIVSKAFLTLTRIQQANINVQKSSCKVTLINVKFSWNFNFLKRVPKIPELSNVMKNSS